MKLKHPHRLEMNTFKEMIKDAFSYGYTQVKQTMRDIFTSIRSIFMLMAIMAVVIILPPTWLVIYVIRLYKRRNDEYLDKFIN